MEKAETTPSYWSQISFTSTQNYVPGGLFSLEVIEDRPGIIVFTVEGKGAAKVFKNEPGGHRFQRTPPTEKRGRVQTSTITVAVLEMVKSTKVQVLGKDLDYKYCRGSGAGGQHKNVTDSAVKLTHKPTGLVVRCESGRSQHANKATALEILKAHLSGEAHSEASRDEKHKRKKQVGTGMRADKIRTIRVQDNSVKDHVTGKTWSWKKYRRGDWD